MPYAPTAVLKKLIEEREGDIRLRNARTLDLLASKGRVRTADTVDLNWNVILSDSTTATVAMTTAGTDQTTGDTVQATLPIGGYKIYHQFSLDRVTLKDTARRGTQALRRLFAFHVDAAILSLRKQVNNYIWTATGSVGFGGFVGMPVVLDDAAVYAGISPVTYPNWIPILDKNATARALSKTLLRNLETKMDIEEVSYDSIVVAPTMSQKYAELWDTVAQEQAIINNRVVDLGTGGRSWAGVPIVADRFCPNTQMVFFDSSAIELLSFDLSSADQGVLESFGLKDNFDTVTSAEIGGLRINVALLPQTNPGVLTFQLFTVPQMKVSNRRMVQAITNLTP